MSDMGSGPANERSAIAGFAIRMVLKPSSMVIMDALVLVIIAGSLLARFVNLPAVFMGEISPHELRVNIEAYDSVANLIVFYGVALESRPHLMRREGLKDMPCASDRLHNVSEHTGITLVVWGIMLEVCTQMCQLAADFSMHVVIYPLRILGLLTLAFSILQLAIHFRISLREVLRLRRAETS